jgi:hypothetical protein
MTTTDRIVVLHEEAPATFLADACRAVAEAVNSVHVAGPGQEALVDLYAELVGAYARLRMGRSEFELSEADRNIFAHLLERIRQSRAGEIEIPLADIADQLHARVDQL